MSASKASSGTAGASSKRPNFLVVRVLPTLEHMSAALTS